VIEPYAPAVLIDLGDVSSPPDLLVADDPPRMRVRGFVVAAVAALAALLPTAAAPAGPPPFDPFVRLSLPVGDYSLVGDTLYGVSSGGLLEAYALPGGQRRWTSTIEVGGPFSPDRIGDLLLVTTATGAGRTAAVDAATGAVRWSQRGTPIFTDPAGGTVVVIEPPNPVEGAPDPELGSLAAIRLADGRRLWSFPSPGGRIRMTPVYGVVDGEPVQIVGLLHATADGPMLFDLATGADTAVPAPGLPGPLRFGEGTYQAVAGGLLVVADANPIVAALRAYDRTTMRPRWVAMSGEFVAGVEQCGPWLCATTANETAAVDPANGRVRWRVDWFAVRAGTGDRSVAFRLRANGPLGVAVLRTSTGQVLMSVDDWRPLLLAYAPRLPLLRRTGDGRIELAVLDVERGTGHRIGELRTTLPDPCDADRVYLVCRTAPGRLSVWAYAAG
jgi:outer membrane protein assembly factor BamB